MTEERNQTVIINTNDKGGFSCSRLIFHCFMLIITGGLYGVYLIFKWLGSQ